MITPSCQRWRERRESYRPAGETINTAKYEVASIDSDSTAKAFVVAHHYSGRYPAARQRIGIYRGPELVGVAVFSHPMQNKVLDHLPCPREAAVELGRLVLLDDVPANGESWFIARCFDLLRSIGYEGVISHADPVARTSADGRKVFPGHVGTIYQATNAVFAGRASPASLRLLPDGSVFSNRAASKIRKRERGWVYAVDQLVAAGARQPGPSECLRSWLAEATSTVTRPLRHHGNFRYLFGLTRAVRRRLPDSQPYPKLTPRKSPAPAARSRLRS